MKLKIKKEILLTNLNNVSKALSNKNLIPALNGIKFELNENGLYLLASDDDIIIQSFINQKDIKNIDNYGSIVVPGKYILEIIRKLPTEEILIETDGSKILITTETGEYNLNGIDSNEYPNYNLQLSKNPIILSTNILKTAINQTAFAISNQEARPLLTGINFKIENNNLEIVATDSYRLAKKIITLKKQQKNKIDITIPGKNLIELIKILEENDDNIEIHVFSTSVLFKFNNILLQSRILNGSYPNVNNLISEKYDTKIIVDNQLLFDTIDRVSLIMEKEKNIIQLQGENKDIIITASSLEIGKVEEKINLISDISKKIKITFNSKFMLESLRSLESKEVEIQFNGDMKPIIIKDPNNDNLIQLILPIKTY
jgi:DNA polymerase-3 subunit beta